MHTPPSSSSLITFSSCYCRSGFKIVEPSGVSRKKSGPTVTPSTRTGHPVPWVSQELPFRRVRPCRRAPSPRSATWPPRPRPLGGNPSMAREARCFPHPPRPDWLLTHSRSTLRLWPQRPRPLVTCRRICGPICLRRRRRHRVASMRRRRQCSTHWAWPWPTLPPLLHRPSKVF